MKSSTKFCLMLVGAFAMVALGACDRRAVDEPSTTEPTTPTADTTAAATATTPAAMPADVGTTPAPATASSDDALALGLLGAVNEHEIAAARQAKDKKVSAPVLAFAEMMETEHGANQAKTLSLGTPATSEEVTAMKEKGASELATLGQKSGKDYETAYIDAMVKGHTEALTLIDTRLLTLASNEAIKQHLTETRGHVAKHLEAAQKLKSSE